MKTLRQLAVALLGVVISATAFSAYAQAAPRTIEVHAKRFSYSPSEITLQEGETVKLLLTSDDVNHELLIPDLHVSQEVSKGHPAEVTIVADKVGDFQGVCGHFCGVGHGSMAFVVHVRGH